jgi:hypothetical protein
LGVDFFLAAVATIVPAPAVEALALAGALPLVPPVAANAPPVRAKTNAIVAATLL